MPTTPPPARDDTAEAIEARRRTLLAAALAGVVAPAGAWAQAALDPVPPRPARPTPGRPGDFDFLAGEWKIRHRRLPAGAKAWEETEGGATCWTILGGVGSVEELRIPSRGFSGMGLRLLDVEKRVWNDHWVNAKSGVLMPPGLSGSFEDGVGIFVADDVDDGKPIVVGGIWDRITPASCRWRQVLSRDAGKTWEQSWIMDWRRA